MTQGMAGNPLLQGQAAPGAWHSSLARPQAGKPGPWPQAGERAPWREQGSPGRPFLRQTKWRRKPQNERSEFRAQRG